MTRALQDLAFSEYLFHVVNILNITQALSLKQEYNIINEMVDILVILFFFINTWCYHIYNIPIGFSDLEYVGVDTKFVFLG